MRKSGLWDQLADVAPQVRAGVLADVGRAGRKPSEAEMQRVSRAVASAYSVHRFRSACLAAISRDLANTHVAALRRWYDGPSGRTITRIELAQSKQDPRTIIEQGALLLETMPASRRRILEAGRQFVAIGTRALSSAMFDAAAELARTVPGSKDKAHT